MNNVKNKLSHKLLAAFLSLVMVLSIVPASLIAQAATVSHPDAVTITVVDDITGEPIEGAKVSYVIYDNDLGTEVQGDDEVPTDANGEVVILDTEPGNIMISSVTVTHDDYYEYDNDTYNQTVTSLQDNFDIKMSSKIISDVTVSGVTTEYDGTEKELVSITGDYDKVTYTYDGNPTDTVPTAKNVGEYEVEVYLEKTVDGVFKTLNKTVTSKITPKDIEITIKEKTVAYNENEQELVEFIGAFEIGDIVTWTVESDVTTWTVDDTNISDKKIPTAMAVGEYDISLKVVRENYNELNFSVASKIVLGEITLGNLSIKANDLTYNCFEQEALTITDQGNYKLMYQFADSKEKLQDSSWTEYDNDNKPMVKDAGEYIIFVKAVKENYNDKETEAYPISVSVAKAESQLSFITSTNLINPTDVSGKENTFPQIFTIKAEDSALSRTDIVYSVDFAEGNSDTELTITDIATIDATTGELNVTGKGSVKVVATLPETDNYASCEVSYIINVAMYPNEQGQWVAFEKETVNYVLGTEIITNNASNLNGAFGERKYYIEDENNNLVSSAYGISVERKLDGFNYKPVLKIDDIQKVADNIQEKNGVLSVKIWTIKGKFGSYSEDRNYYTLNITFETTPANPYTLPTVDGTNDWYKTIDGVVVTPVDGYTISQSITGKWENTTTFNNQGTDVRYVYLKNSTTGGITDKIAVVDVNGDNLKIDNIAPDADKIEIKYSKPEKFIEKLGKFFGFYNPDVTVTLTAYDVTSGIDYFTWNYTKEDGASDVNHTASVSNQVVDAVQDATDSTKYTAEFTITADEANQYRGHLTVTATDKANNVSNVKDDSGNIFIVDTVTPDISIKYAGEAPYVSAVESIDGIHYFNADVAVELTITEANFYEDEIQVSVTKDGQSYNYGKILWGDRNTEDKTVGTFSLNGDGDYMVTVIAKDKSGNEVSYASETITVDKTAAKITPTFDETDHQLKIVVEEHNFRVEDIGFDVDKAVDIKNENISGYANQFARLLNALHNKENWTTENGDKHEFVFNDWDDAFYELIFKYEDLSKNSTKADKLSFTVDNTKPTEPIIEYVTKPLDTFFEVITFGFYNPSVTIRFTAYDNTTGVNSFTWGYTKKSDASTINHPETFPETVADATVSAVQDKNDASKFTAEITLTADEFAAPQFRGYISVFATDGYVFKEDDVRRNIFNNDSKKKDDSGNIIVVDRIAPTLNVEYIPYDALVGTTDYYYNNAVDVTLTVTEANFYAEDVVVTVTKNGEVFDYGDITWGSRNEEDKTVGTFTLPAPEDHSGDGHYVITVEYTDRSNNEMVKYVSDTHTIDTTLPVINVEYDDDAVAIVNTLIDKDGNERKYYAKEKTATVTINEHNFDADEVEFTITAKDVTGAELDADALNEKTEWSVDGDIHTMTITYPGDANYTFDVAYTDKATNKAEDYAIDYFTVDKTEPENSVVEYSTSVLDTVLESVTFGFYNAKMTVKLTVEDDTSEVHSFRYSYLNAGDVSPVNAELIDEEIQAEDIDYSDDRKTATATFEIPKLVLENDNQFNGTVEFTATNRAGLTTDIHKETKRIVVDNIAPTAQVSYNEPINSVGGVSYYDGDINATVVINEANFYANEVKVMVSKDGAEATPVSPVWTDNSTDVHTGTFTLTEDGDYVVTIVYTDYSSNEMTTYTSNQLTIDTDIQAPTYSINGVAKTDIGGSYQDKATVAFNFEDQNFDTNTIKLTRTRFDKVEDVTSKFIKVANNDKGGSGSFTIPSEVGNDGIYVLTIGMTDKAKHTTESQIKFTINRFGSVYEYSDDLVALIRDGGQYVQSVDKDLVITEYNANRLLEGSLKILITRDGEAIDVDYSSNPANINSQVNIGDSGWYQYVYTIKASNFDKDGVYKISLTSAYSADDSKNNESTSVPENSIDGLGNDILDAMNFTVDATAPEIRNIVNLDESIADVDKIIDGKLNVKYTVVDIGGLKSIEILLNGTAIQKLTTEDFIDDAFSYSGSFDISEQDSTTAQKVQFIVTDLAGNVTDTDSEEFLKAHSKDNENSTYLFFNEVTVSRNFLVRWYADKPLFWGSIIGVIVLTGAIWFFIVAKKKKKEEKK